MKRALLFTIVVVGQLYGMEQNYYKLLPPELKQEIISQALSQNNLDDAISMIRGLSVLHGASYDALKDFTKLVHILADKFKENTVAIAQKFNMSVSKKYVDLFKSANDLLHTTTLKGHDPVLYNKLSQLIKEGLDVNATFYIGCYSLLMIAVTEFEQFEEIKEEKALAIKTIKLLLDAGANPNYKDSHGTTVLNDAYSEEIKKVLEDAIQKKRKL